MEHQWDTRQAGVAIVGREILGDDAAAKNYTSRFFDNFGNTGSVKATLKDNTWTWTAESVVAGKAIKERGTSVVSGDTITNKWEYSTDGVKWLPNFDAKMTRVK